MTRSILERAEQVVVFASPPRSTNQSFAHFVAAHGFHPEVASANPDRGDYPNEYIGRESDLDAIFEVTLAKLPTDESYAGGPLALIDTPHHLLLPQYLDARPDLLAVLITRDPVAWARSVQKNLYHSANLFAPYERDGGGGFPPDAVLLEALLPRSGYTSWRSVPLAELAGAYARRIDEVAALFESRQASKQLLTLRVENSAAHIASKIGEHLGFEPSIGYPRVDRLKGVNVRDYMRSASESSTEGPAAGS